ncbi:hypothetical protein FIBSPDRAFT_884917 [Athelia psychrophila]|uniref:Uncharacterized protein n=1 Tax=Athelia psychrophila TaxID=1759441 RepID=A0A166SJ00_9AGAM|nr:hypothetical protein FIBSPDRAFT_884917 [Fibularhizoctonia sp. CBS 109695]
MVSGERSGKGAAVAASEEQQEGASRVDTVNKGDDEQRAKGGDEQRAEGGGQRGKDGIENRMVPKPQWRGVKGHLPIEKGGDEQREEGGGQRGKDGTENRMVPKPQWRGVKGHLPIEPRRPRRAAASAGERVLMSVVELKYSSGSGVVLLTDCARLEPSSKCKAKSRWGWVNILEQNIEHVEHKYAVAAATPDSNRIRGATSVEQTSSSEFYNDLANLELIKIIAWLTVVHIQIFHNYIHHSTKLNLHSSTQIQFLRLTVLAVLAFVAVAAAVDCKPLFYSCSDNSECCEDRCISGVCI